MITFKKTVNGYAFEVRNVLQIDLKYDAKTGSASVFAFFDLSAVKRARAAVAAANRELGLTGDPERVYNQTFEHSDPIPEAKA